MGSGVVLGLSRDQAGDEGTEEGLAASACVVHNLKEAEVSGSLSCEMPRCGRSQSQNRAWIGV